MIYLKWIFRVLLLTIPALCIIVIWSILDWLTEKRQLKEIVPSIKDDFKFPKRG